MGVFQRVGDIVSANVNELVERFEDPETMLRQAMREMDAALARTMEANARVIADERLLENQIAAQRTDSAALQQRAREALARDDEVAARRSLVRRQEHEKLIAALDDQLALARSTAQKLRRQLDAMRVRRSEAERKLHLLVARQRAAEARRQLAGRQRDCGIDDAGFARFERISQKIERAEAETDALFELTGAGDADEIEPESDQEIESQLRALKQGP